MRQSRQVFDEPKSSIRPHLCSVAQPLIAFLVLMLSISIEWTPNLKLCTPAKHFPLMLDSSKKKHCPNGISHAVKRYGFTPSGSQRFRCKTCGISFIWTNTESTENSGSNQGLKEKDLALLRLYVKENWTYKQLAKLYKCSTRTMQRKVWKLLNRTPPPLPIVQEGILVLDATWTRRSWCLLLYRDVLSEKIVAFDSNTSETYFAYLEI